MNEEHLFDEWDTTIEPQTSTLITVPEPKQQAPARNPCLALYGKGEEGVTCKNCVHLRYSQGYRKRFYKCDLRPLTRSASSDHAVGWPSCVKYEARTEPYYGG